MTALNNPVKDFYRQAKLEGKVITISEEEFDRANNRVNEKMEEFSREWKYKNAKSIEEAMHHYLTF